MKNIAVIFGSSTGNTEENAKKIADLLGRDRTDLLSANDCNDDSWNKYEAIVLGTSTWGIGDLQDDWEAKIDSLGKANLKGKKVAIFGLGDADGYPDSFVDAMDDLRVAALKAGAEIYGGTSTNGYSFDASKAVDDNGDFIGLVLDEDNQSDQSQERISHWVKSLGF